MIIFSIPPITLVKSARLEYDLVPALREFDSDFREIPVGDPKTNKYTLWKDVPPTLYLMMLFQNQRRLPPGIHNTILTITSLEDKTNQEVYRQFNEKTKLGFGDADNAVNERYVQEYYPLVTLLLKLREKQANHGAGINFPRI
jgi:hypothetical protein